jgi:hypothetical protein
VTTVAAVLALAAGVVLQLIFPIKLTPAVASTPAAPGGSTYTGVAGWDCPATATAGFEAAGRQASWRTIATGGWAQDGCHGTFQVMPYTGSATASANDPSAVWWFVPRPATRCRMSVYVPDEQPATYRPAGSAQFYLMAGRGGQRFAQFTLDQSVKRGSWVEVGTYSVSPNGIAVLMVGQGLAASPDTMLAITQVRAACT